MCKPTTLYELREHMQFMFSLPQDVNEWTDEQREEFETVLGKMKSLTKKDS